MNDPARRVPFVSSNKNRRYYIWIDAREEELMGLIPFDEATYLRLGVFADAKIEGALVAFIWSTSSAVCRERLEDVETPRG